MQDDPYHTAIRLQLAALGYAILPNIDKVCRIGGWNAADWVKRELASSGKGSVADKIKRWPKRFRDCKATGVRLENGLGAVDCDIDDGPMMADLCDAIEAICPGLMEQAPVRYGGGTYKAALFCRVEGETWNRIASRVYNGHQVEIFGGAPTSAGKCSRQFGIFGPHSHNDDGSVARNYEWADGPQLFCTPIGNLPAITKKQAYAIVAAFERLAEAAGWTAAAGPDVDAAGAVYDITPEMRFDTERGSGLTYGQLCDEVEAFGETRCSAAFLPGRGEGGGRDRCWVAEIGGRVGVYVYGDAQTHFPSGDDPAKATDGLQDDLKAFAQAHGIEPPVPVPTWREVYEGTSFPKASLENVRRALLINGIVCALDTFHNVMTIGAAQPRADMRFLGTATDARIMSLRGWLSAHYGKDFTEKHVYDAVVLLAGENRFDPVADMLAAAEAAWDGVKRLDRMAADYFMAEDTVLNSTFVRKTMIGAVARVRSPGCKFDTILTMESPEGWNKSSSWAVLAGEGNFSDVKIIGATEKEVMEQLAGVWIHENAELAGMRKTEIEMVKAFASRQVDIARPAYGRITLRQPRHSIEVGTTNANTYLLSTDGNRRFWPIKVLAPIDLDKLRADRLQLWGEAAAAQSAGEDIVLPEELRSAAAEAQEARRLEHPIEAVLAALTVRTAEGPIGTPEEMRLRIITQFEGEERVSSKDILYTALGLNVAYSNMGHSNTVAAVMRKLGWTKKLYKAGGIPVKGYVRPARIKLTVVS